MTEFEWVAAALVAVVASGRYARLITWDSYPPSAWLRKKWDAVTKDGEWSELLHCGYCANIYIAFGVVLWGYFTDFNTLWWLINGSMAVAYAGAVFMAYDGDDD